MLTGLDNLRMTPINPLPFFQPSTISLLPRGYEGRRKWGLLRGGHGCEPRVMFWWKRKFQGERSAKGMLLS